MCSFIKGMCAGMVLGACIGMGMAGDKRRGKKMMHRAVRSMEDMVERVSDAIGM